MIDPRLPFIDLHRHLDGNLRLTTILDLAREHRIDLPASDVEGLRPHIVVEGREPDLMSFIGRFRWLAAVLADAAACRRVARENVEDAAREGIDYVELRFSPWFMAEAHGLDPARVVAEVVEGVEEGARATGVGVGLIGILSRTYGPEVAHRELAALLTRADRLVALDLAGDEARFEAALFAEHLARARDAGLAATVHAGEAAGAESMWSAIRDLGATRIGHGVRGGEDTALVEHMLEHGIGIEANLTSNVQTSTVEDYAAHPIAEQLEQGLLVSLNTDDPAISGIDLRHEYEVAAPRAGLGVAETRQLQKNAVELAFLAEDEKAALLRRAASRAPGTAGDR